jgi:hypothetical protein
MASFVKFNKFLEQLAEKAYDLGGDTLKLALTNTRRKPLLSIHRLNPGAPIPWPARQTSSGRQRPEGSVRSSM